MDKRMPDKKQRLLASLDQGMTMVHLDARRPGVLVPPHLKNEPHLLLNLSYRFDPPDLTVGDWGVRSTLTFGGKRFTVAVPWSALYAITSHVSKEFWMYPEDMPVELIQKTQVTEKISFDEPPLEKGRGILLEVVKEPEPLPEEPPVTEAKPRARSHLRLVK
jgi:stringent starvation protein B